jgi:hypothetical protein
MTNILSSIRAAAARHLRRWAQPMDSGLEQSLESIRGPLFERHRTVGTALYAECEGHLYPCDGLAMAVLHRSLNLTEGFVLLMGNHGYICAAALLRFQLDNILRLYGVMSSGDPHGVAEDVLGGKQLNKIKDPSGDLMTDTHLLERLEDRNKGITGVYKWASGYVHLSREHVSHFLSISAPGEDGRRLFQIGNNDDHLPPEHRRELVDGFAKVTRGVLLLEEHWIAARKTHGSREELERRGFTQPV